MSKAPSIRLTLLSVTTDTSEAAAFSIAQDTVELCDAWTISFLRARLVMVEGKIAAQKNSNRRPSASSSSSASLVDSCARALGAHVKQKLKRHPRGVKNLPASSTFLDDSSDECALSEDA